MSISLQQEETTAAPAATSGRRALLLVVGSGRSGTSLFTGILQRLGFYVPQPEVAADDTNPRGFAESKWVVDFHTRLLDRAGVAVSDARPAAWAKTARVALDEDVYRQLRGWLAEQFGKADDVVVKDPRLSWFLPLWRQCAEDVGAWPRFATALRHPAAVVDSKQRSYGTWQGDVERTAGWINQTLFGERATRGAPRVFVTYQALLEDWTSAVARVGEELDLAVVRDASASSIVQVHEFVDRTLSRSQEGWGETDIPTALRELADEVWELVSRLADGDARSDSLTERFEAARAAYVELYEDAEAIAQSSIAAAQRPPRKSRVLRLANRVPKRYRQKLPLRWRAAFARAVTRSAPGRR